MVATINISHQMSADLLGALTKFDQVSRAVDGRAAEDEAASSLSFASLLEGLRYQASRTLQRVEEYESSPKH
jgi:hypothetical protein